MSISQPGTKLFSCCVKPIKDTPKKVGYCLLLLFKGFNPRQEGLGWLHRPPVETTCNAEVWNGGDQHNPAIRFSAPSIRSHFLYSLLSVPNLTDIPQTPHFHVSQYAKKISNKFKNNRNLLRKFFGFEAAEHGRIDSSIMFLDYLKLLYLKAGKLIQK